MKFLIAFILAFLFHSLFAQASKDIVIDKEEKIQSLSKSNNYVNVVTKNQTSQLYNINVYDINGDLKFSKKDIDKRVKLSEVVDQDNSLIYIESNLSYIDKIISVDINSSTENWDVISKANKFSLSPDGRFLITSCLSVTGENGPFEIIDTENGDKIFQEKFEFDYQAVWYDSIRIAFAFEEYKREPNPEYADIEKVNKQIADLHHERQILTIRYKRGEVAKEEYDLTFNNISANLDSLRSSKKQKSYKNQKNTSSRIVSVPKTTYVSLPVKVKIYNVLTNIFELEKSIILQSGLPVTMANIFSQGSISVNMDGIIFLLIKHEKKDGGKTVSNHYIVKLNKELRVDSEYKIPMPYLYRKVEHNGKPYFCMRSKGEYFLVDAKFQKFDNSEAHSAGIVPENFNLEKIMKPGPNKFESGIEINEDKNIIKIIK